MAAGIIDEADRFRKKSEVVKPDPAFPNIYRIYEFGKVPSGTFNYSLSKGNGESSNTKVSVVETLNLPGDTKGWLILRRYLKEGAPEGYLDCLMDHQGDVSYEGVQACLLKDDDAIYVLSHRKAPEEKSRKEGIIVQIYQLPDSSHEGTKTKMERWFFITSQSVTFQDVKRDYSKIYL